jgi:long-chain acyl-CoA synthetase
VAHAAQAAPDAPAIVHGGHSLNWRAFADRVARRATQLRARGLAAGDRVAILASNVPEHLEAAMAVSWAGLIVVPLNTRLSVAELAYILEHSGARLLCCDSALAARAAELVAQVPAVALQPLAPITTWDGADDPLAGVAAMPYAPAAPFQTGAIFYTGGTTGSPKGVDLSHNALLAQGHGAMHAYGLDRETVYMHTAPLFHLADFAAGLAATLACGSHHFLPEFATATLLDAIEHQGVNVLVLVPTMMAGVLDAAALRPGVLPRLRTVLYGAAPIQEPLLRRLLREAPGVGLIQVYGQTELAGGCTALAPEYHVLEGPLAGKLTAAGRPVPNCVVRIVGEDGQPLPNGQQGEVCVSGPCTMTGYWRDPVLTAATLREGWVHTGDLGVMDNEGFLSIVGRLKDMIITGGENVFAGEVESALMFHPAVETAAVIGVPDPKWGEAVHAVVILRQGQHVGHDELLAHCRTLIAGYKCPRSIDFRQTPLPLSGVGKVRKVDLRQAWLQARSGEQHV